METNDSISDLDWLTEETFRIREEITESLDDDDFQIKERKSKDFGEAEVVQNYPEGPGLIYRLERGLNTFCLKGFPSQDIDESFIYLRSENEELFQKLKLENLSELSRVGFFSTESLSQAEVLFDQLVNRRFPIEEDVICNLSDPGYSWWLSLEESGLKVFFRAHGLNREERFIKLGPMGDRQIFCRVLQEVQWMLRSLFPVSEVIITEKTFQLSTSDRENEFYKKFIEFFKSGNAEVVESLSELGGLSHETLLFLKEMGNTRRLWLTIQSHLNSLPLN